jgi:PAS domain S-box-containing protein
MTRQYGGVWRSARRRRATALSLPGSRQPRPASALAGHARAVNDQAGTEQRLATLTWAVEDNPGTVIICDSQGNIEYANARFTRLTGYTAQDVIGKNPRFLNAGQQPPEFYRALWDALTHGEEWQGEFINRKKNGELYWERATISPVKNGRGQITHFVKVAEDITTYRRMEDALQMTHGFLEIANRQTDMDALLAGFVNEIRGVTLCSAVGIRLITRDYCPASVAAFGFPEAFGRAECLAVTAPERALGTDFCACRAVASDQANAELPCYTEHGSFFANSAAAFACIGLADGRTPPNCPACCAAGYQSMAVIPIRGQDCVLGLIHLADPRANMLPPTRVRMFEEVGLLLGTAIQRVRSVQALQESEATARALLDATTDLALLVEPDGTIIGLNEPQARLWKQARADLIGQKLSSLLSADLIAARRSDLEVVMRSGRPLQLGELQAGGKSFDSYISPIINADGNVTRAAIYTRDITAIKQTEAALRHAHDQLATLLALSGDLLTTIDLPSLLGLVLEKLAAVAPYDRAAILTLSGSTLNVVASAGYMPEARLDELCIPIDNVTAFHGMVNTSAPYYLGDAATLPLTGQTVEGVTGLPLAVIGENTRSWLGAPLLARNTIMGLICLGHRTADFYDAETSHIVQTFANEAAIAISKQ